MKIRISISLILSFLVSSYGEDWPQWRGPQGTGVVAETDILTNLPDDPKSTWHFAIGDGFASPVVSGGKVFYLDNQDKQEIAHALDAATGKEIWKDAVNESHQDGFGIGPRTTPLVDGDLVYFQSARGEFQCRNTSDGKLRWRTNFVDDFGAIYIGEKGDAAGASRHGATATPMIYKETIIVQVGSANGASIVAFNKVDGKVVWKSQNDQTAYASPTMVAIGGVTQYIAFTCEGLIGLAPDSGALLWRQPMTTRMGRHVTTPVVIGDLVVVASHQLGLVGTRVLKEGEAWVAKEAWVNRKILMNFSSPVVVGEYLYGLGSNKDVICVDPQTGESTWTQTGIVNTSAEQAEAAFLVMGTNIAALTDGGEFVLFAADPKDYKEVSRIQVCGKTWCNPAYADGKLYLRDTKELRRVELK